MKTWNLSTDWVGIWLLKVSMFLSQSVEKISELLVNLILLLEVLLESKKIVFSHLMTFSS